VASAAVRPACIDGGDADPAKHVRPDGHGLQMIGADAVPDSAQVVEREARWDWADQCFVHDPMDNQLGLLARLRDPSNTTVTVGRYVSSPQPAGIRLGDPAPDSIHTPIVGTSITVAREFTRSERSCPRCGLPPDLCSCPDND